MPKEENCLTIVKLVDVGLDDVDPPLALGCDVQQPKDSPGGNGQRCPGGDGLLDIAQEDVGEGRDDGEHGHLLRIPGAEKHQQPQYEVAPAVPGVLELGDKSDGQCLEHYHGHVHPAQWPNLIDVAGSKKGQPGDEWDEPAAPLAEFVPSEAEGFVPSKAEGPALPVPSVVEGSKAEGLRAGDFAPHDGKDDSPGDDRGGE